MRNPLAATRLLTFPLPITTPLRHHQVPPMTADRTAEVLKRELGVDDLGELFEWIDLESPLGSASISQVGGGGGLHAHVRACIFMRASARLHTCVLSCMCSCRSEIVSVGELTYVCVCLYVCVCVRACLCLFECLLSSACVHTCVGERAGRSCYSMV
jgi:hypothetical protein